MLEQTLYYPVPKTEYLQKYMKPCNLDKNKNIKLPDASNIWHTGKTQDVVYSNGPYLHYIFSNKDKMTQLKLLRNITEAFGKEKF